MEEVEPPAECGIGDGGGEQRPSGHGTPNRPRGTEEEAAAAPTTPATLRRGLAAARARRRAGVATPSPSWKLEPSPPRPRPEDSPAADGAAGRRSSSAASARQLGATLWEIQDVVRVTGTGRRIRRRARRGLAASPRHDDGDVDRVRTHTAALCFLPFLVNVVTLLVSCVSSVIFLSIFLCKLHALHHVSNVVVSEFSVDQRRHHMLNFSFLCYSSVPQIENYC